MRYLPLAILLSSCTGLGGAGPPAPPARDTDEDGTADEDDCAPTDPSLSEEDGDGDGVSSCDGDCDDEEPTTHPGAEEHHDDFVDSDCDGWLGEPDQVWEEALNPDGSEVHTGIEFDEFSVTTSPPWDGEQAQDLGSVPTIGRMVPLLGHVGSVEPETWSGDNDVYRFLLPTDGRLQVSIDAIDPAADYDGLVFCEYEDATNPADHYRIPFDPTLNTAGDQLGESVVPLASGAECFIVIVGYDGPAGDYEVGLGIWPD